MERARLIVEDAKEALAAFVEPPSEQDVAKAKSRIETARVALEKAKDDLAGLQVEPSDLDVAKAKSRIETARIAMEKAEEDLASLLEPPSEQDIARAESRVETARVDLEKAKDELASFLEEPTDLEVAQVKWKIAQAELALQNAEDEDAAAWELDQLAVAEARSIVAKMELEAQNAKESLDELVQSPSDDDLEEANLALERAVSEGDHFAGGAGGRAARPRYQAGGGQSARHGSRGGLRAGVLGVARNGSGPREHRSRSRSGARRIRASTSQPCSIHPISYLKARTSAYTGRAFQEMTRPPRGTTSPSTRLVEPPLRAG